MQILGWDSAEVTSTRTPNEVAVAFCKQIKAHPVFKHSTQVHVVETNYPGPAGTGNILNSMAVVQPSEKLSEDMKDGSTRPGIWMTSANKERYTLWIEEVFECGQLKLLDKPITTMKDPEETFKQQLFRFRRETKGQSENAFHEGKKIYKYTGKENGEADDLVLALMIAVYYSCVRKNGQFVEFGRPKSRFQHYDGDDTEYDFIETASGKLSEARFVRKQRPLALPVSRPVVYTSEQLE
jgi:hypothetical protein